jgi:hypothetical protein
VTLRFEKFGFDELQTDLRNAGVKIRPEAAKVTGRAMLNIKRDVQRRWKGMPHLRRLPYAVNYDVHLFGGLVVGEVGADHARPQGKLAWVAEYGTPTSAPHPGFRPAGDKEIPSWQKFLDKAAADVLGDKP